MPTALGIAVIVFQAVLTVLPGSRSQPSAELRARLAAHVKGYTVSADNFADALVKVAGNFKIPMGIAWVRTSAAARPVRLAWKDTNVRGIIQGITHTQSGYGVGIEGSVVHVYPRALVPQRDDFLSLTLPQFEIHDVAEIASRHLGQLVRLRVAPPRPTVPGGMGFSQFVEAGDPNISISLRNPTAAEALDAIVLASPFKVWLVTFAPGHSLMPTGFRRTVSPVSGQAVPDADQPFWELLKWGREPY